MKNRRFIVKKIESILMKRYALEKIISLKKFLGILFLTLLSFAIFFVYWVFGVAGMGKKIVHIDQFTPLGIYALVLVLTLGIGYVIWWMIGNYIPKFVLIGLLGWFLIGGGLISNLLVPGEIAVRDTKESPAKNLQLPVARFTGVSENSSTEVESDIRKKYSDLFHRFLFPSMFKQALPQSGDQSSADVTWRDIIMEEEFGSLRLLIFVLLLLVLVDLFFTVTMFGRDDRQGLYFCNLSWRQRETAVKIKVGIVVCLLAGLFFLTLNYLFLLLALLGALNIFLIKWEIEQRGQNHKMYTRAVLFLFLMQFFSIVAGEVFFLVYLPVLIYIKPGVQVLDLADAVLLNWIVLVGSLASVLIGMTTQVVWSGRRLTEKFH
jgi:hypothetical protein